MHIWIELNSFKLKCNAKDNYNNSTYSIHKVLYKYVESGKHMTTEARNQHESCELGSSYPRNAPNRSNLRIRKTYTHRTHPKYTYINGGKSCVCIAIELLANTFNVYLWASIRNEWLLPSLNFISNAPAQVSPRTSCRLQWRRHKHVLRSRSRGSTAEEQNPLPPPISIFLFP